MCIFRRPSPPPPPAPLPPPAPAPTPPPPPPAPAPLPAPIGLTGNRMRLGRGEEEYDINPSVRAAAQEAAGGTQKRKGTKGSTKSLRIKRDQAASGVDTSINPGNTSTTGGLQ